MLLDHPIFHSFIKNTNGILLGLWIIKFLTMKFSQSSFYFIPLRRKYSPQHSIFESLQPMRFFLNVRGQLSQPYEITGKIHRNDREQRSCILVSPVQTTNIHSYNACYTMAEIKIVIINPLPSLPSQQSLQLLAGYNFASFGEGELRFSETSVSTYDSTRCQNPEITI